MDRLGEELGVDPPEAAGQVQMMAALAAEQILGARLEGAQTFQ